jgi:hypothetical protein
MIGDKIRRKIEELKSIKKVKELITGFREHEKRTYPYIEEDDEGISTYLSPRHVELVFRGTTPKEGYERTVNRFKLIGRIHKTRITLEGDKVVVDF